MRLLVQPEDGIQPVVDALDGAKKSIQILIFRFDRAEVERALVEAAHRGVSVTALIAHTNHGGEKYLRRFEMRLLEQGITVARTADDLVRYHGKMFIIDGKELYLLAFNYTHIDITLSRSFAAVIKDPEIVREAQRLFECDVKRTPYLSENESLVVSPQNTRQRLKAFIAGAKKQLLIYEMKLSDPEFIRQLNAKVTEGVEVRIITRAAIKNASLPVRISPMRLHIRGMVRDGHDAFIGSMSMRRLELASRREVGVIFHDPKSVKRMAAVFEQDWATSSPAFASDLLTAALDAPAKRVAKSVARQMDVKPIVAELLDKMIDPNQQLTFEPEEVALTVRNAFREEVHDAVLLALREMVANGTHSLPVEEHAVADKKHRHEAEHPDHRKRH
ncbi:MAG: phospholipase D-like domain-containing protein [Janthinobacterium lividum]